MLTQGAGQVVLTLKTLYREGTTASTPTPPSPSARRAHDMCERQGQAFCDTLRQLCTEQSDERGYGPDT
jgi:hypothetical protein